MHSAARVQVSCFAANDGRLPISCMSNLLSPMDPTPVLQVSGALECDSFCEFSVEVSSADGAPLSVKDIQLELPLARQRACTLHTPHVPYTPHVPRISRARAVHVPCGCHARAAQFEHPLTRSLSAPGSTPATWLGWASKAAAARMAVGDGHGQQRRVARARGGGPSLNAAALIRIGSTIHMVAASITHGCMPDCVRLQAGTFLKLRGEGGQWEDPMFSSDHGVIPFIPNSWGGAAATPATNRTATGANVSLHGEEVWRLVCPGSGCPIPLRPARAYG